MTSEKKPYHSFQQSWRLVLNIGLFQMGWFACLLLPVQWSSLLVALVLLIHFAVIVPSTERVREGRLVVSVLCVGFIVELLYLWFQVLIRTDESLFPPLWLLFIWLLFATTFRYSMAWLRPKLLLAAIFAGVAAPMSYLAGANLNALVSLNSNPVFALSIIGISWAIIFPLMLRQLVSLESNNKHSSPNTN